MSFASSQKDAVEAEDKNNDYHLAGRSLFAKGVLWNFVGCPGFLQCAYCSLSPQLQSLSINRSFALSQKDAVEAILTIN